MDEEFKKDVQASNKKDLRNVIIVVLIILVLVLLAALFVFVGKDKLMPEKKDKEEQVEKIQEVNEAEKENVKVKINRLLGISDTYNNAYGFRGEVLKRELTDGEKQYITLMTTKYDEITDESWKDIPKVKEDIEFDVSHNYVVGTTTEFEYIKQEYSKKSLEEVKEDYKSLFGEELTEPLEEIGRCPTIYYFKDYKVYYRYPARCGGTSGAEIMTYLTNYRKTDHEIIVDLYVGMVAPKDYNDYENKEVYSDFEVYDAAQDGVILHSSFNGINAVETEEKDSTGKYIINDNNKELFSKYVLTFRLLEDGDYYFKESKQEK